MKKDVKVVAGCLLVILFIVAGIIFIKAGIGGMENIISIALTTLSFLAAMISGASTHYEVVKNEKQWASEYALLENKYAA